MLLTTLKIPDRSGCKNRVKTWGFYLEIVLNWRDEPIVYPKNLNCTGYG